MIPVFCMVGPVQKVAQRVRVQPAWIIKQQQNNKPYRWCGVESGGAFFKSRRQHGGGRRRVGKRGKRARAALLLSISTGVATGAATGVATGVATCTRRVHPEKVIQGQFRHSCGRAFPHRHGLGREGSVSCLQYLQVRLTVVAQLLHSCCTVVAQLLKGGHTTIVMIFLRSVRVPVPNDPRVDQNHWRSQTISHTFGQHRNDRPTRRTTEAGAAKCRTDGFPTTGRRHTCTHAWSAWFRPRSAPGRS